MNPGEMRPALKAAILAERKDLEWAIGVWEKVVKLVADNPQGSLRAGCTPNDALACVDKTLAARKRLTELAQWDTD